MQPLTFGRQLAQVPLPRPTSAWDPSHFAPQLGLVVVKGGLEARSQVMSDFLRPLIASAVYSLVGMTIFALGFLIIRWVTPFSIRKEIEEDQNVSLGIVIGSVVIGLAIIIAAAIHG